MERTWETVQTSFGPVRIKIGRLGPKIINTAPEFDDCRKTASEYGVPVKRVWEAALVAYNSGQS
jgi:pyridinium-3,5-bisthiocarboxylic acid mononucleotide nickel chelatase